jgi:hypothetical protein
MNKDRNQLSITAASFWNENSIEMRRMLFPRVHPLSIPMTFADLEEHEKEMIREEVPKFK